MVDQVKRREYVSIYLQGAINWREKGVLAREVNSLSSLLLNYLAIAVLDCNDLEGANDWCSADANFLSALQRYRESLDSLVDKVDAGEIPASTIAGNYPHLVFTHLTWALGEFEVGERFAAIAARPDVLELSTPFWQEYSRAVGTLIEGSPYSVGDLAAEGQEQYWITYLRLIESATNNQDITTAIAEIDDAFIRRNSDNTIQDDAHEIEGSGSHPVRWDFRRDGLLNYIQSK